jgi:hypothetical protein
VEPAHIDNDRQFARSCHDFLSQALPARVPVLAGCHRVDRDLIDSHDPTDTVRTGVRPAAMAGERGAWL